QAVKNPTLVLYPQTLRIRDSAGTAYTVCACGSSRKGRSKKEAEDHTNRPNPGGHERKIVLKLQRTEQKRKATTSQK
uniref:Uncharacterized protein n=1 Tax=Pseudonaja textilis TaxID=8673 RepID=A0A670Z8F6_PSETE